MIALFTTERLRPPGRRDAEISTKAKHLWMECRETLLGLPNRLAGYLDKKK